jgi:predicted hydrocarbon binding protein
LVNYEFDEDNGIIRDKLTGERCFIVYEPTMEDIFNRLSKIFKSGIVVLLQESSRIGGEHIVDSTGDEAKTDIKRLLSRYTERFARVGFGRIEVSEFKPEEGRIGIRVWNNLFAEMRHGESTYCGYVAGLVSRLYEGFLQKAPKVKEVKCIGNGDPYCEFVLTRKAP